MRVLRVLSGGHIAILSNGLGKKERTMSRPAANGFFEADFSKYMDMSKMMGEFKMPSMNMEAVMTSHRKNLEACAAVAQAACETMQALARRQGEWMRQCSEECTSMMNAIMAAETPEEKVIRHAEISKAAMDKCMANCREIAETVARTNCQAMEAVSNRMSEGLDEFRDLVRNGKAAA
jgi:phasin family protein